MKKKPPQIPICICTTPSLTTHLVKPRDPYGQFLRLRRICTLDQVFEENASKLIKYYLKRGCPLKSQQKHHIRAARCKQNDLLDTINKEINNTAVNNGHKL